MNGEKMWLKWNIRFLYIDLCCVQSTHHTHKQIWALYNVQFLTRYVYINMTRDIKYCTYIVFYLYIYSIVFMYIHIYIYTLPCSFFLPQVATQTKPSRHQVPPLAPNLLHCRWWTGTFWLTSMPPKMSHGLVVAVFEIFEYLQKKLIEFGCVVFFFGGEMCDL